MYNQSKDVRFCTNFYIKQIIFWIKSSYYVCLEQAIIFNFGVFVNKKSN